MRVITSLNQKGGCGKSSCTYHLAGAFAGKGLRVLLADMDPQSSISQGFWGPNDTRALDPEETVAALFPGNRPHPSQVIKQTGIPGVDIIPGSRAATRFNTPEPWTAPEESQTCLRDLLAEVADSYDVVLADCPPNLHLCSWVAMVASDHIIIPVQPEDFGAMGIVDVQESIAMVRAVANPGLNLLGYLLTMVSPRKTLHMAFEETLRSLSAIRTGPFSGLSRPCRGRLGRIDPLGTSVCGRAAGRWPGFALTPDPATKIPGVWLIDPLGTFFLTR